MAKSATPEPATFQRILGKMGSDFPAAERELSALAAAHPGSFEALFYLAFLYNFRKEPERAAVALERALAIRPDDPLATFNLAYCKHQLGHLKAALPLYDQAASLGNGQQVDAAIQAAAVRHQLGGIKGARQRYDDLLNRNASHAPALYGLLRCELDSGDRQAAARTAADLQGQISRRPDVATQLVSFSNRYDYHGWRVLDDKSRLATLLRTDDTSAFPYLPTTFVMPDEADALIAAHRQGDYWLAKPAKLFGGQGLRLFADPQEAPRQVDWAVQRYVADPLLVDGKKSHLRLFLLITEPRELGGYLWRGGIVRFAPEAYRLDAASLGDAARHVTNTVRFLDHPAMRLDGKTSSEGAGNVWQLVRFLERAHEQGFSSQTLWSRFDGLASGLLQRLARQEIFNTQARDCPAHAYAPKILGLDILLDATGKPWLLEIEVYPALSGGAAPAAQEAMTGLFQAAAAVMVDPYVTPSDDPQSKETEIARAQGFKRCETAAG